MLVLRRAAKEVLFCGGRTAGSGASRHPEDWRRVRRMVFRRKDGPDGALCAMAWGPASPSHVRDLR